jgi:hypothetical protein
MNDRAAVMKPRRRPPSVTKRLSEDNVDRLPVSAAIIHRRRWLDWVALWTVRWLSSGSTSITVPRVSIGWFDCRWHENRSVITRSAAANIASTSPNESVKS